MEVKISYVGCLCSLDNHEEDGDDAGASLFDLHLCL